MPFLNLTILIEKILIDKMSKFKFYKYWSVTHTHIDNILKCASKTVGTVRK